MAADAGQRIAVVAGATGLVGRELTARLLKERRYGRIVALARRALAFEDERLVTVEARFDALGAVLASVTAGTRPLDVFCCLGTTLRRAGSEAAFRRVDHDYVLALGRWAKSVRADRMIVVSALGADAGSRLFYNRVKGETERDLAALGLTSLVIVRPSLLAGARAEFRLGERLALLAAAPLGKLMPRAVRPIDAADVAQAMIDAALMAQPPALIESSVMQGAASAG